MEVFSRSELDDVLRLNGGGRMFMPGIAILDDKGTVWGVTPTIQQPVKAPETAKIEASPAEREPSKPEPEAALKKARTGSKNK